MRSSGSICISFTFRHLLSYMSKAGGDVISIQIIYHFMRSNSTNYLLTTLSTYMLLILSLFTSLLLTENFDFDRSVSVPDFVPVIRFLSCRIEFKKLLNLVITVNSWFTVCLKSHLKLFKVGRLILIGPSSFEFSIANIDFLIFGQFSKFHTYEQRNYEQNFETLPKMEKSIILQLKIQYGWPLFRPLIITSKMKYSSIGITRLFEFLL